MDTWVLDRVTAWETTQVDGDGDVLSELATKGFTGAVEMESGWLWLVNGNSVIERDRGTLMEDGVTTAYRAPDPGLPLLFAMQSVAEQLERGFTDEKPLEAVHERLQGDTFSGYLELSEYVLSGDYYVVYRGTETFPVAFVGGNERLYTGEKALDKAMGEVGIFKINQASIDVEPIAPGAESPPTHGDSITPTD